jgi:hypothetical protein
MDRQGIRTLFDHESKRLKQVKLSGPRRERVSLDTFANELAAREVEFRQEAKYGKWSEPGSNVLRWTQPWLPRQASPCPAVPCFPETSFPMQMLLGSRSEYFAY